MKYRFVETVLPSGKHVVRAMTKEGVILASSTARDTLTEAFQECRIRMGARTMRAPQPLRAPQTYRPLHGLQGRHVSKKTHPPTHRTTTKSMRERYVQMAIVGCVLLMFAWRFIALGAP